MPVRNDPDEAGLIGAAHLAPKWLFKAHDAILAVATASPRACGLRRAGSPPSPPRAGGEGELTEDEINRRHNEKMARRKAARDRMLATKTEERGLLIVDTGKGKGKSTAAFGLVLRCLGHGMRVGIVQFVKGVWSTGERAALEHFGGLVTCRAMGEGFTWDTHDRARDIAAARNAWAAAQAMIADPGYRLVLLDELNIVLRYDYLPLDEVVAALKAKPRDLHIVVTGRNARPELIDAILRVVGTPVNSPWSTYGWYIFAGVAGLSLLSKYVIRYRGSHVFNPSNIGLVVAFIVLGSTRVEPLDFWWAPLNVWMLAAYAVIITGGLLITRRLHLLALAATFWVSLAIGVGVLAGSGHCMTTNWAFGPVCGFDFWRVIVTSPEVLIFLFFMITDPKTVPAGRVGRIAFGFLVAMASTLLMAPQTNEFGTKVALLAGLVVMCAVRPLLDRVLPEPRSSADDIGQFANRPDVRWRDAWRGARGSPSRRALVALLVLGSGSSPPARPPVAWSPRTPANC